MRRLILFFLVMMSARSQESAQYLQSAVRDLRELNLKPTLVRADTAMVADPTSSKLDVLDKPSLDRRIQHGTDVPPLSLTKGELAALYESAIAKGETLKLDTGDDTYINAAIHDLGHSENAPSERYKPALADGDSASGNALGYYYYYYPIKSFIDEMSSQGNSKSGEHSYRPKKHKDTPSTQSPNYQFHSHHHEHNITINKEMMADKNPKTLEPLFMAISGFIGMAVMFVLSTLILPKFGSKSDKKNPWVKHDKMEDFARLALNAIDENDCTERFRCELSKTARTFHLQDNRFVKLLKRIAPSTFGKYMDNVRKYESKLLKCTAIPCRKKANINTTKNNNNNKNNTNKKTNGNNKTNNKGAVKKKPPVQKKH